MTRASKAVTAFITGNDPERARISPEADRALLALGVDANDELDDDADDEVDERVRAAASALGVDDDEEELLIALKKVAQRKRRA